MRNNYICAAGMRTFTKTTPRKTWLMRPWHCPWAVDSTPHSRKLKEFSLSNLYGNQRQTHLALWRWRFSTYCVYPEKRKKNKTQIIPFKHCIDNQWFELKDNIENKDKAYMSSRTIPSSVTWCIAKRDFFVCCFFAKGFFV